MHDLEPDWRRIAADVHLAVRNRSVPPMSTELPMASWDVCRSTERKIEAARLQGWELAAARLERELSFQVRKLRGSLDVLCGRLLDPPVPPRFATAHEIYADLVALFDEFEQVTCDTRHRTLSVTTEPIELEGVYLGPFAIQLPWSDFAGESLPHYRVIAIDPHPAASHDGVTHPHVQNETVCEGDGRGPIRAALEQGRIFDFFLIVARLLRTYNDGSPHVALDDWDGFECIDCGGRMAEDDRWSCDCCDESICDDCRASCPGCDGIFCNSCVTGCGRCEDWYCVGCLSTRDSDNQLLCQNCLDESGKEKQPNDEETLEPISASTGPAVQPHGVGEAAVSA